MICVGRRRSPSRFNILYDREWSLPLPSGECNRNAIFGAITWVKLFKRRFFSFCGFLELWFHGERNEGDRF